MNNDVITQLIIKNPEGSKTALVIYHPGLSSFSHDVSSAFADGLVSTGWRVELATPSIEAPINLSKYSLLVVASNTYGFNPDTPTTRHLARIGDLEGIETVVITLGAGSAEQSQKALENLVEDSNGVILENELNELKKKFINECVSQDLLREINTLLDTERLLFNEGISWASYMFEHVPVIGSITNLKQIKYNIKYIESRLISEQ